MKYEGDLEPLIMWAVNRGHAAKTMEPPEAFRIWVREMLPGHCRNDIRYWVGVITPDSELDDGWVKGYPHTHVNSMSWPPDATTVMMYLIVPEAGGEFWLGGLDPADPYTSITVKPGLAIIVDAKTWHGVKPVISGTRMAIIATGLPQ